MSKLLIFKVQEFKAKYEQQKGSASTASNEKAPKKRWLSHGQHWRHVRLL
jgi:hypothetical protein